MLQTQAVNIGSLRKPRPQSWFGVLPIHKAFFWNEWTSPSLHGGSSGTAVSDVTACVCVSVCKCWVRACEHVFVCSNPVSARNATAMDHNVFVSCVNLFQKWLCCVNSQIPTSPSALPPVFLKYLGCEVGAKIWIGDIWCHAWQLHEPGTRY